MPSLHLEPSGQTLDLPPNTPLQDVLFNAGAEFPCGGRGRCRGCRVKVIQGELPVTPADQHLLSPQAIQAGWRLACQATLTSNLTLELAQWETTILSDEQHFEFTPSHGLGIAIDLGTTTLAAQLLNLQSGEVLASSTALNPQARHGADIMTRVEFATAHHGAKTLTQLIRNEIYQLIQSLLTHHSSQLPNLHHILIVGNTAMHHFFGGIDPTPLAHAPFESPNLGLLEFTPSDLDWSLPPTTQIRFLPCLGGFVGSDILAGLHVTRLHQQDAVQALVDLGTNGEIIAGNRDKLICAGTAAGPAFEGARISHGMRASTGAISQVNASSNGWSCHIIGGSQPRGICGSGLVDAIATGLNLGHILPNGKLTAGQPWELAPPVSLTQRDIRELQLAKGAVATGLELLANHLGPISHIHLAGAFGNYINRLSAIRIGLLPLPISQISPAGNTALLGAKALLFSPPDTDWSFSQLRARIQHVSLHEDPNFESTYLQQLQFAN